MTRHPSTLTHNSLKETSQQTCWSASSLLSVHRLGSDAAPDSRPASRNREMSLSLDSLSGLTTVTGDQFFTVLHWFNRLQWQSACLSWYLLSIYLFLRCFWSVGLKFMFLCLLFLHWWLFHGLSVSAEWNYLVFEGHRLKSKPLD